MDIKDLLSATLILFSIIDILGNIPVFISLREKGLKIEAEKATIASGVLMILFLFVGEGILALFGVDVNSFAIAGAIVIFLMGLEMILGRHIFKDDNEIESASVFPIAFPLLAGTGTMTTILSLRSEYNYVEIILAILINLVIIYLVIRSSSKLNKILGKQGTNILRKVFGIVLLAIAIKLFKTNIGF